MSAQDRAQQLAIRAGALGAAADPQACTRVLAFLDALLELNRSINLTAIRDPAQARVLHALDSLAVGLAQLRPTHALDLGSGNGFPGIAVAALYPDAQVDLMERTAKKARALTQLLEQAPLPNVRVLHLDAAQAPHVDPTLAYHYDLVTARAVAEPVVLGRLTAPLTIRGAQLALWLDRDTVAPAQLPGGFASLRSFAYHLPHPAERRRRLAVYTR